MYFESKVKLREIQWHSVRAGFPESFHRLLFELHSDAVPPSSFMIWVHPAFPEDQIEKVGRTFLRQRLFELAEAASFNAFSETDVAALWERVKPEGY